MINLNTSTVHKVLKSHRSMMGITHVIIENNVPSWLRGLNKHTGYRYLLIRSKCTSTYYTYIHTTQSTQILQKQDEYKAHM